MPISKLTLAFICLFCSSSYANELLPVPLGHQSAAFVLDDKIARPELGARADFIYKDDKGIPKKVPFVTGFVLGTRGEVVFFELDEREAVQLAKYRARYQVSYRKVSDPVPEELKSRREYRDSGLAVKLAPQMRRLTVTMDIDTETVSTWTPGEMITFFGAIEYTRHDKVDGAWKPFVDYRDAVVMFRSAAATDSGQYEVTVVAGPREAQHIIRAEVQSRLTVNPKMAPNHQDRSESRCYVVRRAGAERIRVEIPCGN